MQIDFIKIYENQAFALWLLVKPDELCVCLCLWES